MPEVLNPAEIAKEAKSAYKLGNFQEAAQAYAAAQQGYMSSHQIGLAAEMANNRSVALLQAKDAEGALQALEGTIEVFQEQEDRKSEAMAIGNRAAAFEALGRLREAEEDYWQSAQILKEIGEHDLRLSTMQAISALQIRTGRQFQAVATMQAGLDGLQKPSAKQRLLKRFLGIPQKIINKG